MSDHPSSHWGPDPEKLAAFKARFPEVNPVNPTDLGDADWTAYHQQGEQAWAKVKHEIAKRFTAVVCGGMSSDDWARSGRHSREVEAFFTRRLKQLLYVPSLASGGSDEMKTARRLSRLARKLGTDGSTRLPSGARGWLYMLAAKYRELPGRYYIFKVLPDTLRLAWEKARKDALASEDVEGWRACEVVLKGIPAWITDFIVEPLYVLVRVNKTRERVVRIHNVHGGITELLHWPSEEFSTPKAMRIWLNNNANCANWAAGERELNFLGMDIGQHLNDKEVLEVPLRAHHYPSGIWFYSDCALLKGDPLTCDRNGVYWHNSKGYLPSEKDQEGEYFRMGPNPNLPGPFMHPLTTTTREEAREMFVKLAQVVFDSAGGFAGWMALGTVLAFFASKEVFERYTAIPGLWISAEPGQGKSSLVRWMMRIFGYQGKTGLPLPGSTQAALRGAMQQYGDMPLWLDEFQGRCNEFVVDIAKAAYDRGGTIKKTFGDQPREIRTGLVISGVETSGDAQLRSRYVHIQLAAAKRIGFDGNAGKDRYLEIEKWSGGLYRLGRFVLQHREEFARLMVDQIGFWSKDPKLVACDDRSRIVHGAAYSAFVALATLLETHGADQFTAFRGFVRGHIEGAQQDVRDQLYVSLFFDNLLNAVKTGDFGETPAELRRYFKVVERHGYPYPPAMELPPDAAVSPHQQEKGREFKFCAWAAKHLFISQGAVEVVMAYRRRLGIQENLSKKDLSEQMKGRSWLVPPKSKAKGVHQIRFEGGQETAWCIDVDQHELGRLEVSDAEFDASLLREDGSWKTGLAEWPDRRQGPLYTLIARLERNPRET